MNLISGKMTSKGQLTIPVELRNYLKIEEGDRLEFIIDQDGKVINVKPVRKKRLSDVAGKLKVDKIVDVDEIRDEIYRDNILKKLDKEN
ncbi:AbrB/MazE/SpoVT family DNA-binding domain-containing protein [Ammoniphilus sp. YIM 78166]|uniref:AbrB/MazE/SpoVT family DNA-binding domain-containing protein n=1 Tax=Ammoniphilus sp. YIM 78166 TaxID=1644106 RepID=UPI00106FE186|nr:AbrB/MazE/SpoVT family DNA-binding domain-containing protein [Ammoniphilus sp. YIM 78166]